MAEIGWIKLHRKVLDCWIWQIKPYDKARAWVDLLLLVMHRDKKMVVEDKPITIERGSYLISRGKLADRWGWSIKKVDAYLNTLENEKMVTTIRTRKGTLITIVNYDEYQIEGTTQDTTEDTPQGTTEDIPQDTSQGIQNKNIKNNKNNNICSNSLSDIQQELDEDKKIKAKQKKREEDELKKNFEIIYKSYPKKVGKTKGFELYKGWLKGRDILGEKIKLTNKQMWSAIARYKEQLEADGTEKQFIKQFDTFMNKPILDYIGDDEQ